MPHPPRVPFLPRVLTVLALIAATALLAACGSDDDEAPQPAAGGSGKPAKTTKVTVALDWTPNTNHTGLYVADQLGYYEQQGLEVEVLPYANTAPETLVTKGRADVAFSYQAGVAYARAAGQDVVGIFTPVQKGQYAIGVSAKRDDISSPKDLDGKTYAGFGTPDEGPLLEYVIKQDGGKGEFKKVTLNAAAYEAVYNDKADFTIPVTTWEGVQARLVDKPLKFFRFTDFGFPDQYSTLVISSEKFLAEQSDVAKRFLAATQKGYAYGADQPRKAAELVVKANPKELKNPELVVQSQEELAKQGFIRGQDGKIGVQSPEVWQKYGSFLFENGLLADGKGTKLTSEPDWSTFYTNDYLPGGTG